ncbi:poly(A)-specific ribonuclease PARN-like isoform X1 [Spodoptera litura]|uniref:Poly(A)-specific ribonuclease PARN-like isoform X1 n=1 Tax=Spodoptera litura TaxID=69820 RepID=A0A9J7ELP6_SPOLT|nr:poly(A)-specific ribonuclease PARN-like isoform X1 [Spodoptera litura]
MEVVRKNFKETLPLVKESIDKADFLAIDTEFTGLINGRDVTIFDSPEDYYLRLMNGSSEFLLIQFGMSCFYWDEKRNHYLNDTYNFYLYPRGRPGPDRLFLCQSSSLDFLASNGFDFNKLIREGISYMTSATETKLRENLAERQLSYSKEKDAVRIPDENRQQIEDICNKVKNFIEKSTDTEMEINRCNSFIRMLLFQELKLRFKDEVIVDTKVLENKNRILKVIRKTADMDDQDTLRKKKEWDELEEAIGFSRVAQMISQSEKLVVGHNMLLDLLHTLGHFFQQLPSDYPSFKEFSHCMFPKLLDTKYMSSLPPFKDKLGSSVLTELLSTLGEPPFSLPKIGSRQGRGYSHLDDKEHEAGYDAYITGLCFLAMHGHLARMRGEDSDRVQPQSVALKPFLNKLFLAKTARQDSPYINLDGADPTPPRDHVFHLVFPKEWQRSDLSQLFSPFGAVTVYFLDECSAFVGLDQRDQASDVMRVLSKNNRVTLTPYHKYKSGGSGGDTEMALRSERKSDTYKLINKADAKSRQGLSKSNLAGLRTSLQVPQLPRSPKSPMSPQPTQQRHKVNRTRSNSASLTTQPVSTRKRTSSGVFHVDGSEPVAKKSISPPLPDKTTNGRDKTDTGDTGKQDDDAVKKKDSSDKKKTGSEKKKDKAEKKKDNVEKKDKIVEKFDSKAMSDCVTAFKESDSWD